MSGKRHDPQTREDARKLRRAGRSIKYIARHLQVAQSTASVWTKGIQVATTEIRRNGRKESQATRDLQHQAHVREVVALATQEWQQLKGDPLFLFGVGLYIGEGDKTERLGLTNADPVVIRSWVAWCRRFAAGIQFRGKIMAHPDLDETDLRRFWSELSGVQSISYWTKPVAIPRNGKNAVSRYGTFRLVARHGGVDMLRKMQVWSRLVLDELV